MAIINYLRKMFKKKDGPSPTVEYIRTPPELDEAAGFQPDATTDPSRERESEIDLSRRSDLEGYARDISMSKESIERWISSGLLMPEELKVAEELVKIMRKHQE